MAASSARRLAAEFAGTAILLATVIGSGIMGERLAQGNDALALLGNTLATGVALAALILMFGPVSGAHFNPLVTTTLAWRGDVARRDVVPYLLAQLAGALLGVVAAHLMFDLAPLAAGTKVRTGSGQWLGEFVATFGLIGTIWMVSRSRPAAVPAAVAAWIVAGYWFTSSTSFANPTVTLARSLTDSFAGIRPADAPGFILAEIAGALAAALFFRWLGGDPPVSASPGRE